MVFFTTTGWALRAQNWQELGLGMDSYPRTLFADSTDGKLYIGGNFQNVDGQFTGSVISYDGNGWDSLGAGCPVRYVTDIERYQGKLYAVGNGVGIWDGSGWQSIGTDGFLTSAKVIDGNLLLMGSFEAIGGDSMVGIATWDGVAFSDVHGLQGYFHGTSMNISSVVLFDGQLFIAGSIYGLDSLGFEKIMRWDGGQWRDVGGGIVGGGWINDMQVYDNALYVAGYFNEAQGAPGNNIAKWNGQSWERVGDGLGYPYGQVLDLAVHQGRLYAVGGYGNMGAVPVNGIAAWDGLQWCSFGWQIDNSINSVGTYQGELVIAGGFHELDGDSIRYLARWIGGGVVDTCVQFPVAVPEPGGDLVVSLYPNPSSGRFSLEIPTQLGTCRVGVRDLNGRVVIGERSYHAGDPPVDVSTLPAGVYVVRVRTRAGVENIKLVVN